MNVFRDACAGCHGDPNGISQYGQGFYPRVPQFAIDPPRRPDWQLFWIVKNDVRYSGMSAWDGQWHNDKAVSDDRMVEGGDISQPPGLLASQGQCRVAQEASGIVMALFGRCLAQGLAERPHTNPRQEPTS